MPDPDVSVSPDEFVLADAPTVYLTMTTPLPPVPPATLHPLLAHAPLPELFGASLADPEPPPPPVLATPLPPTTALASLPEADAPPPPNPPATALIWAEPKKTPPPPPPP